MAPNLLQGPWMTTPLPLTWYASINGGRSAFSVRGNTERAACLAAADRLWRDLMTAHGDPCDPFELDALSQLHAVECERMVLYTPAQWDAACLQQHRGGAA
jgi:hypothetical protein